jgi:hypothetical protein
MRTGGHAGSEDDRRGDPSAQSREITHLTSHPAIMPDGHRYNPRK